MTATRRPKSTPASAPAAERAKPPRAPDHAALERDLATVMRRYNTRFQALDEATAERDRVIRDAIEAGLARARIVTLTQLSPARIDQIRRGARL